MSPVDWTRTCIACQYCCTYVSLEIDAPRAEQDFDSIRWYLAHKRINIYVDVEGSWYFLVNSECENLTAAGCSIYEKRFNICREYAAAACEMTLGEPAEKVLFRTVEDFDRWLEFNRSRLLKPAERRTERTPAAHHNAGPMGRRRRPAPAQPASVSE